MGKLFGPDKDWWHNACLNWQGSELSILYGISEGFKLAGDDICEKILNDENCRDIDKKIFPIVFLYRHYVEIAIKESIVWAEKILEKRGEHFEKIKYNHHKIDELLGLLELRLESIGLEKISTSSKEAIIEFHEIDNDSYMYRYATRKNGEVILQKINHINARKLYNGVNILHEELSGLSTALSVIHESIDCV